MTDRPIIFSPPMVKELIAGKKTQTRRLGTAPCRNWEVGDRLWVRENFRFHKACDGMKPSEVTKGDWIRYEADGHMPCPSFTPGKQWPCIFMPRWASRITLKVTRIRIEPVRSISREDAWAEGIQHGPSGGYGMAVEKFSELWDSLHAEPGTRWADNPFVVALTFDVIPKNLDRIDADASL